MADAARRAQTDPPAAMYSHYAMQRSLQAIAAPRGDGKTTRCEVGVLKAVLSGQHPYGVLLTATQKMSPKLEGNRHEALYDCERQMHILNALIKMLRP